jgi:hypothetical protein
MGRYGAVVEPVVIGGRHCRRPAGGPRDWFLIRIGIPKSGDA